MLDGFFLSQASPAQLLEGQSDAGLVVLSVLIAIVSAAVCLRLAGVARVTTGVTQQAALLTGSLVLGSGIWAMHFVGMLAFDLCLTVQYDTALTLFSMVPSLLASWIALRILSRPRPNRFSLLVGGVCVGVGIGAMHYSGMAAMQMAPQLRYDPFWFAASLVVAVVLSTLALWIRFALRERQHAVSKWATEAVKTVSALFMGGAISGMHYTAMAAARFVGTPDMVEGPGTTDARTLGITVAFAALAVIGLIGLLMGLLRYRTLWRRVELNEQRLQALLSERKKTESRLRVAASVFEHGYEGFMVLNAHFRVIDINHAYQRMSGFSKSYCVGRTLEDLYGPLLGQTFDSVQQIVANTKHWQGEIETLDAGGVKAVHRISMSAVLDELQRIQHYIVVLSDVTQEKSHERELEQIALYDSLTGLPNRRLLNDRLAQGIHAATRQKTLLAVLYVDLDGFKQVNDLMGHADGDLLLCELGRRIRAELRGDDTAARVGGDEMVLLLGDWNDVQQAEAIIARMLEAISRPVALPRGTVRVTASMGMSIFPLDAQLPEVLLDQADRAMYDAKQRGKNQFRRFQGAPDIEPDSELVRLNEAGCVQPASTR